MTSGVLGRAAEDSKEGRFMLVSETDLRLFMLVSEADLRCYEVISGALEERVGVVMSHTIAVTQHSHPNPTRHD